MGRLMETVWAAKMTWLPILLLVLVLVVTFLLGPRANAPFVYQFF